MLLAVILLLLIVFVFLVCNQLYIDRIIPDRSLMRTDLQFKNYKDRIRLLVLGDSFPASAVNPEFLPNSFNLACSAETYEQTYLKMRKVLNEKNSVRVILMPLDIHSFARYRDHYLFSHVWYWSHYASYSELSRLMKTSRFALFIKSKFPVLGFSLRWIARKPAIIIRGWRRYDKTFAVSKTRREEAREVLAMQFKEYKDIDAGFWDVFLRIIDLALAKGKRVVLIKYPLTESYFDEFKKYYDIKPKEFYGIIKKRLAKYKNIKILDYQKAFLDDALFADPIHMNVQGAELFTKRLARDLKRLRIAS